MKSQNSEAAGGEIILYQTKDGSTRIDVRLQDETVWLTQAQMAELFQTTKQNISLHIQNIFDEGELLESSTVKESLTVQKEGKRLVSRSIEHYNLDVIISTGYRVKSIRGIQFRIWASSILKEYLINGYCINREKMASNKLLELKQTVELLTNVLIKNSLVSDLGQDVLNIITGYSKTWDLLIKYDEERLTEPKNLHKVQDQAINYEDALLAIQLLKESLKNEASDLFGLERSEGLKSILGNLEQAFAGKYLYPSLEERAAHLLYFIIKNHPFTDGNKRIGCLLFVLFLQRSGVHLATMQSGALTALALLIAESNPIQKELMIKLIINLIM